MELTDLRGIGPKKKDLLRKLDIYSVSDLYNYYPTAFEDRTKLSKVSEADPSKKYYFRWRIESRTYQSRTRRGIISYLFASEEESDEKIKIIWFNDRFSANKLELGQTYKFYTKVFYDNGSYQAYNPIFCGLEDDLIGSIVAIYPLTAGINQKQLSAFILQALENYDPSEEIFDDEILRNFGFSTKYENLYEIHKPSSRDKLIVSKSQLKVIDFAKELLYIDYVNRKLSTRQDLDLQYDLDEILGKIPFELTRSQVIALGEILTDAQGPEVMNRLLIGDVGSGKTILAIIAMIVFGINGYQSAMMVPTEVLASQQFEKNMGLIESFGLSVALLTSSVKDKENIKKGLASGKIDMVIGTHAIIQDDVSFSNLKFAVNDEQHRFGVGQRQLLGEKSDGVNFLSMTATPIPRTLSLRLSKILDLSMITELPKGRKPIETRLVHQSMEEALFAEIRANLEAGRQVYVVSNNIDSEDKNSVEKLYKRYKNKFKKYKVGKLHGKMKASEKEEALKDFASHKINILVATTVIEVGIDVANASTMVIYNANHFGLSTLHQLRGRVGRGEYESYCYLVSTNVDNHSKLNILVKTNNGFEIAKKDYDLRGGGKILSSIQHGRNLDMVEYMSMDPAEIDKSFEIFEYVKDRSYDGVNFSYIEKFFKEDKRIILN